VLIIVCTVKSLPVFGTKKEGVANHTLFCREDDPRLEGRAFFFGLAGAASLALATALLLGGGGSITGAGVAGGARTHSAVAAAGGGGSGSTFGLAAGAGTGAAHSASRLGGIGGNTHFGGLHGFVTTVGALSLGVRGEQDHGSGEGTKHEDVFQSFHINFLF
jgi:hypothetical protein